MMGDGKTDPVLDALDFDDPYAPSPVDASSDGGDGEGDDLEDDVDESSSDEISEDDGGSGDVDGEDSDSDDVEAEATGDGEEDEGDDPEVAEEFDYESFARTVGLTAAEAGRIPVDVAEKILAGRSEEWTPSERMESIGDPEVLEEFRSMSRHYERRIRELNGQIVSIVQQAENRKFDSWFDGLDKEWGGVFGRGKSPEPGSKPDRNRTRLRDAVDAMRGGYERSGRKVPDDLFDRALRSEFGEEFADVQKKQHSSKVQARQRRFTNRATSQSMTPEQRAVESVRKAMQDHGMDVGSSGYDDFE